MNISNIRLRAFYECALNENMTLAAKNIAVTQSALSQRISHLEDELECTLFIREGKKLTLTSSGVELLKYCRTIENLESDILGKLTSSSEELAGTIRIAGYSSIMRSLIIDKISKLMRDNKKVSLDLQTHEVINLENVLKSGKADFIITDYRINSKGIIQKEIGQEEFVVIQSSKYDTNLDTYLDHGPHDNATESFFDHQSGKNPEYKRSFMGDVYGIIDGVERGLGLAIMSKHLIENNKKVKMIKGYKKYYRPITLHYFERSYYSELIKEVIKALDV